MKIKEAAQLISKWRSIPEAEAVEELLFMMNGPDMIFPFTSDSFIQAWRRLIKEPKWRKKTVTALQESLDKLKPFTEEEAIQAIKDSIAGGYQGIFPEKTKSKGLPAAAKTSVLKTNKNIFT